MLRQEKSPSLPAGAADATSRVAIDGNPKYKGKSYSCQMAALAEQARRLAARAACKAKACAAVGDQAGSAHWRCMETRHLAIGRALEQLS